MSPRIRAGRRLDSIRVSLVLVALVPSVTLAAVWGVTTSRMLAEGLRLRSQTALSKSTGALGTDVTLALEAERRLSAERMALPDSSRAALDTQRQRTDAAVRKLVSRSDEVKKAPARIRDRMYPVTAAAESLEYYRSQIDNPTDINTQQTLEQYTDIIDSQIDAFHELSEVDDGDLTEEADSLVSLENATELASQEDAMLTLAWPGRRLSQTEYTDFARLVGARRWLVDAQVTPFLTGGTKAKVERITGSGAWRSMESIEDAVIAAHTTGGRSGAELPDMSKQWRSALDTVSAEQSKLVQQRTAALLDHSSGKARDLLTEAAWVSAGGLVAVLLSVALSWRITRSLFRRLRGLRAATLRLAESRLPEVVARLNRGQRIDIDAAAPSLDYGTDELGQVAQAFNAAQRTAVNTAVELGESRRGFQKVILGVARHTQNLVNRQLTTLDELERWHEDPEVLAGLYELDSTASQLRRYEENLVIISGGQPGRRWTEPVAVVDVLRSAVGEVAEYQRVSVHVGGDVRLAAPAVADVIHLLAELIENATVFSPAPSQVRVHANLVVKGLVIEIDDGGVGMSDAAYAALNRQLAEPPRFNVLALADDLRLGMFVIGRLAARHGITVTLRSSPYGGTTAIVLLPDDIVVRETLDDAHLYAAPVRVEDEPLPRRPAADPVVTTLNTMPTASRSDARGRIDGPVAAAPPSPSRPASSASSPARAGTEGLAPLPRRVPQTSLAAELHHEPAPAGSAAPGTAATDPAPTAEEAASSLSAFQRGTRHARTGSDARDGAGVPEEGTPDDGAPEDGAPDDGAFPTQSQHARAGSDALGGAETHAEDGVSASPRPRPQLPSRPRSKDA